MSKQIKLNFNSSGVLTSTNIAQIRQGDADVKLIASFEGKNNANYIAKFTLTRPDDKVVKGMMSACATPITDYERILDSAYYFAVNGAATLTVFLFSGDQVLAQGQATISIEQTDFDEETTITPDEYDELLELIASKLNITAGIVKVQEEDDIEISAHTNGQVFFIVEDKKLVQLQSGSLEPVIDFVEMDAKIITNVVISSVKTGTGNIFQLSFINGNGQTLFVKSISLTGATETEAGLVNTYAQSWKGVKTFNDLPQTKEGRVYNNDRQMTDKGYVDNKVGEVQEDLDTFKARTDNPHQVTKAQVGLGNVDNVKQVPFSEKGVASGVATLDQNAKIPMSQLPDTITGQLTYAGTIIFGSSVDEAHCNVNLSKNGASKLGLTATVHTWSEVANAMNTHRESSIGLFFILGTYGTGISIVDTDITLSYLSRTGKIEKCSTGDWLIVNNVADGTGGGFLITIDKIDNTDAVVSVNGKTGNVELSKTDIGLGNVDNTSDEDKPVSTAQQQALDEKMDLTEARNKLQAKVVSVDITITPDQWSEDKEFTSENVFGTLGFVNSDDLILFNAISNEDDAYANTYKVRVDDVVSTEANETYVYFKCNDIPTGNVSLRVNLIKKNTILGDMTGFLNVADLDGETVAFQEGKVRVIGGGTIPTASQVMATNGQSVQQNLERIDERIDDDELVMATKVVVESESDTTIGGLSVPALTVEQIESVYNALVAGNHVVVSSNDGEKHFTPVLADSLIGETAIHFVYYNLLITYWIENDDVQSEYVDLEKETPKLYSHFIHIQKSSGTLKDIWLTIYSRSNTQLTQHSEISLALQKNGNVLASGSLYDNDMHMRFRIVAARYTLNGVKLWTIDENNNGGDYNLFDSESDNITDTVTEITE